MGRNRKPTRIMTWRGEHYLFYFDEEAGKTRRRSCRALGAKTEEERQHLLENWDSVNRPGEVHRNDSNPKDAFVGLKMKARLKEALREVAKDQHRSLSSQIVVYIERGIEQDREQNRRAS